MNMLPQFLSNHNWKCQLRMLLILLKTHVACLILSRQLTSVLTTLCLSLPPLVTTLIFPSCSDATQPVSLTNEKAHDHDLTDDMPTVSTEPNAALKPSPVHSTDGVSSQQLQTVRPRINEKWVVNPKYLKFQL